MPWRFSESPSGITADSGVYIASTESDLDDVDDLWREVYGHQYGWLPVNAPALHKDHYHHNSTYLLGVSEGRAVGTMRLVRDSPQRLPVEQFTSIEELRAEERRLIEVQRLMIIDEYRNRRVPGMPFGVFAALIKGCLHWCLRNGYSHIVADLFLNTATTPMSPLLALGFQQTGIEFVDTELDEPDRSVALLLEVGELFSRPFRTTNAFYRYLIEPDAAIDVYA
ncbi:N-acyl amino acid synthase FeeM domain-containing protein [Amycolatopsis sp. EV170708-02-1]|uniref:N-acyl amino acid synthase FeeM domain-containing protein n=1 Tax=Amycolatopsis sp. EV170708-02-1 TaxID=2919322 RepID=UPI001F0BF921|nr:GNAT family N-acyltransferase [Amycolatopsis sp. EV170708-02-1]UMP00001.1 GNAT family N-acetyltransferase [Amycolatopsis sp. EV170708-02-1]